MATEILASGTAATGSSDIVTTSGTPVTIFLKVGADVPVPSQADCDVQIKDAGGKYHTFGKLTGKEPAKVIDAPGTFRVYRNLCSEAFGVDKE